GPGGAGPPGAALQPVRRVGACPVALVALADWLLAGGVTTGAMASPGVYGMPLVARLEARGVQLLRIAPRQATHVPGRPKTARLACKWLPRRHAYGLRAGACRPAPHVSLLPGAVRPRPRLPPDAAPPMPTWHKACAQMHLTRTQGVRERTGGPGMAILTASTAGERDPVTLSQLRHPPGQHDTDDSAKALQGTGRAEHL